MFTWQCIVWLTLKHTSCMKPFLVVDTNWDIGLQDILSKLLSSKVSTRPVRAWNMSKSLHKSRSIACIHVHVRLDDFLIKQMAVIIKNRATVKANIAPIVYNPAHNATAQIITEALEGHFYLLLITYYLLLITYYLLLITYYLSLITYYLLLIISFITPITAGNSKYTFPVTAVAVVVVVVAVYL